MIEKKFKIRNKAGIHCRPASMILNTINSDYPDIEFSIRCQNEEETELNSILALISLGLQYNDTATLVVDDDSEEGQKASEKIAKLFEYEFDFPPRS